MSGIPADDQLRAHIRQSLTTAGISHAEAARQLGLSTKHLCQMLTGRAALSLIWAEGILGLCGMNLVITVRPDDPCGAPHHNYPDTRCTEPSGHYRRDRDPHAGPLIVDGREIGGAVWDEPKEQR